MNEIGQDFSSISDEQIERIVSLYYKIINKYKFSITIKYR